MSCEKRRASERRAGAHRLPHAPLGHTHCKPPNAVEGDDRDGDFGLFPENEIGVHLDVEFSPGEEGGERRGLQTGIVDDRAARRAPLTRTPAPAQPPASAQQIGGGEGERVRARARETLSTVVGQQKETARAQRTSVSPKVAFFGRTGVAQHSSGIVVPKLMFET